MGERAQAFSEVAAWHEEQAATLRRLIKKAEDWSAEHNDGWRGGGGTFYTATAPIMIALHEKAARRYRRLAKHARPHPEGGARQ